MTHLSPTTPGEAFDALWVEASAGDPADLLTSDRQTGFRGRGQRYLFLTRVPDQMVALPDRTVPVYTYLTVIAATNGAIAMQLSATWTSIFGQHESVATFAARAAISGIHVTSHWREVVPTSTLEYLDIHTGNVSASDYHNRSLKLIRGEDQLMLGLLSDGTNRVVSEADFLNIAIAILRRPAIPAACIITG